MPSRDRVPFEMSQAESEEQFDSLFGEFYVSGPDSQLIKDAKADERDRIRAELISWIESLPNPATVSREYFRAQFDRICPRD